MKLDGRLVPTAQLDDSQRADMLQLMQRHYANVSPEVFASDLAEKEWIVQLLDPTTGELCGFSTQSVWEVACGERQIRALFSGDTIIDPQYWGDQTLQHLTGQLALSLIDRYPGSELYWFLISQGYKTYRFLPVFFREFFPRFDCPTPVEIVAVIDALSRHKYPAAYDAAAGVIRTADDQYRLREGVAEITDARLRDPHVRYFVERNPRHAQGDELCCVARLSYENLTPAAVRVFGVQRSAGACVAAT